MSKTYWLLCKALVCSKRGLSRRRAGSLYAADDQMALEDVRDAYTRRGEGCLLWAVKASKAVASQPEGRGEFFDLVRSKVYRHPAFYAMPDGMEHM